MEREWDGPETLPLFSRSLVTTLREATRGASIGSSQMPT